MYYTIIYYIHKDNKYIYIYIYMYCLSLSLPLSIYIYIYIYGQLRSSGYSSKGGCSRRGVQRMGAVLHDKLVYNIIQITTHCFHCTPLWWILIVAEGPRNGKLTFRNGAVAKTAKRKAGYGKDKHDAKTVKRLNWKWKTVVSHFSRKVKTIMWCDCCQSFFPSGDCFRVIVYQKTITWSENCPKPSHHMIVFSLPNSIYIYIYILFNIALFRTGYLGLFADTHHDFNSHMLKSRVSNPMSKCIELRVKPW